MTSLLIKIIIKVHNLFNEEDKRSLDIQFDEILKLQNVNLLNSLKYKDLMGLNSRRVEINLTLETNHGINAIDIQKIEDDLNSIIELSGYELYQKIETVEI